MKSKVFNKGNDRILALEDHCNDDEEDDVVRRLLQKMKQELVSWWEPGLRMAGGMGMEGR